MPGKAIFEELQEILRGRSEILVEAFFLKRRLELHFAMGAFLPEICGDAFVNCPFLRISMGPPEGGFSTELVCMLDEDFNLKAAGRLYRENGRIYADLNIDAPPERLNELSAVGGRDELAELEKTILGRIQMIKVSGNMRPIMPECPRLEDLIPYLDNEPL